jgi:hypothetical protein
MPRTALLHHRRAKDRTIRTRILRGGGLELEPPGVAATIELLFP